MGNLKQLLNEKGPTQSVSNVANAQNFAVRQ